MDACDVVVVGGGPGGSACAWKLREAGLDVVVVDKATFPRDKVCAGWITTAVVAALRLDVDDYRRGRTFQSFARFRVGLAGDGRAIDVSYAEPVSFGIRRCEFDTYLLRRSGARLAEGSPAASIRRDAAAWIVNEAIRAPMLVGAGGHWCPVARMLNAGSAPHPLVAAQEFEVELDAAQARACALAADEPELYFCRDMKGYGWAVRKERFVNVGFGHLRGRGLPAAAGAFMDFLKAARRVPADLSGDWRGHAYLVDEPPRRRIVDAGVLLVGDAAGLAYPRSGEGIGPAIDSGILAAMTIVEAGGRYTRDRLAAYETRLRRHDGASRTVRLLSHALPAAAWKALAHTAIRTPWFARYVLLDRWFLHRTGPTPLQRATEGRTNADARG